MATHPEDAFFKGRAIFCLTEARRLEGARKGEGFAVCAAPARDRGGYVPYLGSSTWIGVVPKSAANAEAAFDLLAELSGPAVGTSILQDPLLGGGPIREDQLGQEMRWDFLGLAPKQTAAAREALEKALIHSHVKNPVIVLRIPDAREYRAALVKELRAALADPRTDPKQALQRVEEAWLELIKKRGAAAHREDYRKSLGLGASE
jgi:ABC-type glycerol-3-phosphate transport system substrate-binding protein